MIIPEEIEGLLIISFGEDRTFELDLLSPDGVLRDDITIHLNPNGGTYICLCTLRREGYEVRWRTRTQESICSPVSLLIMTGLIFYLLMMNKIL